MKLPKRMRLNQSGALSFMTVVIFMIIITTITLAYVQSVTRQQRDAQNYDFSTRAYYAAESGVQDGIRALMSGATEIVDGKKETCTPIGDTPGQIGVSEGYGLSYTCQLIDATVAEGTLEAGADNVTVRIRTQDGSVPSGLRIQWGGTDNATRYYGRNTADMDFSSTVTWNRDSAEDGSEGAQPLQPLLRTTVVTHPADNFLRGDILQRVLFLNPVTALTPPVSVNFSDPAAQQSQLVTNARCGDSALGGTFPCSIILNLHNTESELYVNLSSIYRSARFQITAIRPDGTEIPLGDTTATIDVTGKAGGSIYRRVRQTVAIGANFRKETRPNAALVSAEGICKSFSITNDSTGFVSDCNPLTD